MVLRVHKKNEETGERASGTTCTMSTGSLASQRELATLIQYSASVASPGFDLCGNHVAEN
jgi:hypothetical protein